MMCVSERELARQAREAAIPTPELVADYYKRQARTTRRAALLKPFVILGAFLLVAAVLWALWALAAMGAHSSQTNRRAAFHLAPAIFSQEAHCG